MADLTPPGAIFALKKMKMYEGEVNKLQGARMTLETQIASLEGAAINVEVFKAMQSGATAMKQIRGDLYVYPYSVLPSVSFCLALVTLSVSIYISLSLSIS
jgi:prefoldin subunit 5